MKLRPLRVKKIKTHDSGDLASSAKAAGWKRRRLKYIAVLPSFITLLNGACGFIAIIFASRSQDYEWGLFFMRDNSMSTFSLAAYMIFLAMIADVLDGRVARLTRTTSSFGGQLDSISDVISFAVAPAFISIKLVEFHLEQLIFEPLWLSLLIERSIFFSAILFVMCVAIRLARFNVENEEEETAHMNFSGLPSPAGAGVIVSLIIFHQYILRILANSRPELVNSFEMIAVSAFPIILLLTGLLMISRIRYPHLANQLLRGKKPLPALLALFATAFFLIWNIQITTLIGFSAFALFGVFRWLFGRFGAAAKKQR